MTELEREDRLRLLAQLLEDVLARHQANTGGSTPAVPPTHLDADEPHCCGMALAQVVMNGIDEGFRRWEEKHGS